MWAEIKRTLSETVRRIAAAQAHKKQRLMLSVKLMFALINVIRMEIEIKGAK